MMRILVLGGNGFIGSHLVDALLAGGHQVRVYDTKKERFRKPLPEVEYCLGDFCNIAAIDVALKGIDVIFHLISTTIPLTSNANPIADVQDNLIGTLNLLNLMRNKGISRIVFLSSGGTVYGKSTQPITEDHPLEPICSYGVVKLAIERYLLMYQSLYGIRPTILRAANPYGPRQEGNTDQGVIANFLYKLKHDAPVEVWGDGTVIRDFIYISDLISLCVKTVDSNITGIYNVGSGVGHSLTDVVVTIADSIDKTMRTVYKPGHVYDVPYNVLSISKVLSQFDWQPKIVFQDGVLRTWSWMNSL